MQPIYIVHFPGSAERQFQAIEMEIVAPNIRATLIPDPILETLKCSVFSENKGSSLVLLRSGMSRLRLFAEGSSASQFEYTSEYGGMTVGFSGAEAWWDVDVRVSEICYRVDARPLPSGQELTLVDTCISTNDVLGPQDKEATPYEIENYLLEECLHPPSSHWTQWCALFETAFVAQDCSGFSSSAFSNCESARKICLAGDLHSPGAGGVSGVPVGGGGTIAGGGGTIASGGMGATGGESETGGSFVAPDGDLGATNAGGGTSTTARSCSFDVLTGDPTKTPFFLALALGALSLGRRRNPHDKA